jgi:hypothetical protein
MKIKKIFFIYLFYFKKTGIIFSTLKIKKIEKLKIFTSGQPSKIHENSILFS